MMMRVTLAKTVIVMMVALMPMFEKTVIVKLVAVMVIVMIILIIVIMIVRDILTNYKSNMNLRQYYRSLLEIDLDKRTNLVI